MKVLASVLLAATLGSSTAASHDDTPSFLRAARELGVVEPTPGNPEIDCVCGNSTDTVCVDGFEITLTSYTPAAPSDSGTATYVYEVCAPLVPGDCRDDGSDCYDNQDCGTGIECVGLVCPIDKFQDLSHVNFYFPDLGGLESCLSGETEVTVTCTKDGSTTPGVIGDGSCAPGSSNVAKCDVPLKLNQCLTMTIEIAGELTELGAGGAVVETKAPECVEACILGPACESCGDPPGGGDDECLTRTIGFWGTHPHIVDMYVKSTSPITVCGNVIDTTLADGCSTSQALCTSANDCPRNPQFLALAAQLTGAKINLAATSVLFPEDPPLPCDGWEYEGQNIQYWIDYCEPELCDKDKNTISESGCIEALTAFNESPDTLFDATPSPFDRPGPADPSSCQAARNDRDSLSGGGSCGGACPS